jgi:hypothetical protein
MYAPIDCRVCKATLFYPDEVVIGVWNGEPQTRFDVLDFDQYDNGVPEGYEAYCLDCAPCECEFHPPFMSDNQAKAEGFCFVPACDDENEGFHRHYPTPSGSDDECLCLAPKPTACECEDDCDKFMCDRCGEKVEDRVLTK